jgi:hypothetical protein
MRVPFTTNMCGAIRWFTKYVKRDRHKSTNIAEWLNFFAGMYALSGVAFQHTLARSRGIIVLTHRVAGLRVGSNVAP